jgi:hypothetical protein
MNRSDRLIVQFRSAGCYWSEVAELVGLPEQDVRSRAETLPFPRKRMWAPDEDSFLKENKGRMTAAEIGVALRRTESSVNQRCNTLGLTAKRRTNGEQLAAHIRRRHAEGWTDAEITREWNAEHQDARVSREWLCELRGKKLGLPHNAYGERRRRQVAAKTQEQLARAGAKSLAEVRAKRYLEFAASKGWPGIARPRCVQILNLLYEQGPQTREAIAAAIGMPWRGTASTPASRNALHGNGPGGTYLSELMRLGLVVCFRRHVARAGVGKSVNLYSIAPNIKRNLA